MTIPIEVKPNPNIPTLAPGYTVKVHTRVVEGDKARIQIFQGVVIKVRGGTSGSFTVRRVAYNVGVERTFPLTSPFVEKVEVVRIGKVRRARLFYLRKLSGRAARIKEKRGELVQEIGEVTPEELAEPAVVAAAPEAAITEAVKEVASEAKAEAPQASPAPAEPKPE